MYQLEEIIQYLSITMPVARIEKLYNMISHPILRVNTHDEQWVAFNSSYERQTAYEAIEDILKSHNIAYSSSKIVTIFNDVNKTFEGQNLKPRIPFYILMLDQLV